MSCYSCDRCIEAGGAYYCRTADQRLHLVLKVKSYMEPKELAAALAAEGVGCEQYSKRVKAASKRGVANKTAPSPIANPQTFSVAPGAASPIPPPQPKPAKEKEKEYISFRSGVGWIFAAFFAGAFILVLTLSLLGVT